MLKFEKTAIGIKKTLMQGVCYSIYNGENRIYGVLAEGGCATFVVINLDKKKIIFQEDAPGATGSWGVTEASDGRIYFGSYVNAGFYRFDPKTNKFGTIFKNLPGAKFIFSLDTDDDNNIYGGTWPDCSVFKYNGNTEQLDFYEKKIVSTEDYVRIVMYNKERQSLYCTVSAHSHIIEYKEGLGAVKDVFPKEYSKEPFARLVGFYKKSIYVYMALANEMVAIDMDTGDVVKKIQCPDTKSEVLPKNIDLSKLIISSRNNGFAVNPETEEIYHFTGPLDDVIMGIWPYSDGHSILISSFEGKITLYNTVTGVKTDIAVEIPRKNIEVRQIHKDMRGTIYASGYLRGGICAYNPDTDTAVQYDGVGQSEGITSADGKIYFGKYPGAQIFEYNPQKPWDMPGNPKMLLDLKKLANQDRPFAVKVFDKKLYIGTIPNYGDNQGALTIYDTVTGEYTIKKDFSDARSIVSLEYDNGILFGGTTVCGGLGSYTKYSSGTVFAFDTKTEKYLFETEIADGCKNAGGLCLADNNRIYGCADSTFFIMNSVTGKVEFLKKLTDFNRAKDYKWEVTFIKKGPGKLYYIVTSNTMFSFNPETMEFVQLVKEKVNLLEFDDSGRLYCQYEENVREIIRSIDSVL